jgi:septal ring factor EnvC (AmiA/AmiB activator)
VSEERLERIEYQISQLVQTVGAMQQNVNAVREDISSLRNRVDSVEGTLISAMRDGFHHLEHRIDDIDIDLAITEEKTEDNSRKARRLNARLMRLERRDNDNF